MKKYILYLFFVLLFVTCGNNNKSNEAEVEIIPIIPPDTNDEDGINNALTFINKYVENCNKLNQSVDVVEWVYANQLTTDKFKRELKKLVDDAFKKDPELGIGADPIFDAQDYPKEGFIFESFDKKTGYIIVKGVDWEDFKLTIKIVKENNNWLVDGCGMINVPVNMRVLK